MEGLQNDRNDREDKNESPQADFPGEEIQGEVFQTKETGDEGFAPEKPRMSLGKKIIIAVVALIVVIGAVIGGVFMYINSTTIGMDQAVQVALADAGVAMQDVAAIKSEFEWDDGLKKYEVEFYANNLEYSYEIDAETGRVIAFEID